MRSSGTIDQQGNLNPLQFGRPAAPIPPGYISPEQGLRDVRQGEQRSVSLSALRAELSGSTETDQLASMLATRKRYAELEYAAVLKVNEARLSGADKEQADLAALDQKSEKLFQAQLERDQRLLEMALRQKQAFQQGAVDLAEALRAGNVGGFVSNWTHRLENQLIGNAAGMVWGDGKSGLSKLIPHTQDGTFLGKLFSNTAFGPDPLKAATDLNTMATAENTRALLAVGVRSGAGGAAAVGNFAAKVGGGSLWSSSGSAGDTGYTSDGVQRYSPENYDAAGVFLGAGATSSHDPSVSRGGGSANFSRYVSYAGAGLTAGYGIYSGVQMGGGRGVATGAASLLGGAALIPGPQQPFVAAGALMAGFITTLYGDPRVKESQRIDAMLASARYSAPEATTYTMDRYGRSFDYNTRGDVRPIQVTVNMALDNIDAKSLVDRSGDIAEALASAVEGHLSPRYEAAHRAIAFRQG